jgi:hypothetical protein
LHGKLNIRLERGKPPSKAQSWDERHIGGGHRVIAQPLFPHPGGKSATAIIVKTSPLRFMKATPIPPRQMKAGSFLVASAPSENRNRLRRSFSGAGMRERAAQAATR